MKTRTLIREYVEYRRSTRGQLSQKTIRGYFDSARFAAEYWPPSPEQITKSLQALRQLSSETERTHLRRLRTIGSFAAATHGLPNPYLAVQHRQPKPGPKRVFTPDEYAMLRAACRDIIDIAQLDLLMGTGIRIGETPLLVSQIGPDHLYVSGKTGPRYAAIMPRERELLLQTARNGRLWHVASPYRRYSAPLSLNGLRVNWRRLAERAGITGAKKGPHTARRTFASNWMMSGGTLEALKPLLGHSSIRTTEIYARETPGWVASQLSKIDPLGRMRGDLEISGPNRQIPDPALLPQEKRAHAATR